MIVQNIKKIVFLVVISNVSCVFARTIRFDSRYSRIKVVDSAEFFLSKPISAFDGKLEKDLFGTVAGEQIIFENGLFQEEGQNIDISSVYDPMLGAIILDGNKSFYAGRSTIQFPILVSGTGNFIGGQPIFLEDITLVDSNAELIVSINSSVTSDIILNGGCVGLGGTLKFEGNKNFVGPGQIVMNGYSIITGHDAIDFSGDITFNFSNTKTKGGLPGNSGNIELNSCVTTITGTATIKGDADLNGHGQVLQLDPMSTLEITKQGMQASNVCFSDVIIKGIGNGSIFSIDSDSTIQFTNVVFEMDGDYGFVDGVGFSSADYSFIGPCTFIMKNHTFTFGASSSVTIDGVVVCKEPAGQFANPGNVIFDGSLNLINDGLITFCNGGESSGFEYLDSRIDVVESCCDAHEILISINDSRIDGLEECCSDHESRIENLESCCEEHDSRLDVQDSYLEVAKSEIDVNDSRIDGLEECCSDHESRIEILEEFKETLIEIQLSLPDIVFSRLDDLDECCSDHESRIEDLEECCEEERSKYPCDKFVDLFSDTTITRGHIPHEEQAYVFTLHDATVTFDGSIITGVALEKNARIIFKGTGSVIFKNNIFFNASEGYVGFFDDVSFVVESGSQFITDPSQVQLNLFTAVMRKMKDLY